MHSISTGPDARKGIKMGEQNRRHFVLVPNAIVRGGHKPQYLAVLLAIASHAGDGECYASGATLAKEAAVKPSKVFSAIKYWEELGHIRVERKKGVGTAITTTFDFAAPMPEVAQVGGGTYAGSGTPPMPEVAQVPMPEVAHKEEPFKKNLEEETTATSHDVADDIKRVFEVFYLGVNPGINFGNRTSRAAAEWLIRKYGVEKTIHMAEYAVSIARDRFAPVITTPYQLKEKLGQLAMHKQKNAAQTNVVEI